jgi:hypothetical protein
MDVNKKHNFPVSVKELVLLKNALSFYAAHKRGRDEDLDGNRLTIPYEFSEITDMWSRVVCADVSESNLVSNMFKYRS